VVVRIRVLAACKCMKSWAKTAFVDRFPTHGLCVFL
jgi:hypothetical protein